MKPKLTKAQREVLEELSHQCDQRPGCRITPMDVGGMNGTHHCSTLAALCHKGFAGRKKYGCHCKLGGDAMFGHPRRCRGSFTYWITDLGTCGHKGQAMSELLSKEVEAIIDSHKHRMMACPSPDLPRELQWNADNLRSALRSVLLLAAKETCRGCADGDRLHFVHGKWLHSGEGFQPIRLCCGPNPQDAAR